MKLNLTPNQYFDDDGNVLAAGRLTVCLHGSDTKVKLYTITATEYVEVSNPIITSNDGRIPAIYFDAGIVDVTVEKPNLDGSYELMDTYSTGWTLEAATQTYGVDTVADLDKVDPTEQSVVVVNGYYTRGDSPSRVYIWDANLPSNADNGYIRTSDVDKAGRWILLWDDEVLPCSVYGIIPGEHEDNINAIVNYPATVGSMHVATAPIIRFTTGDYQITTNISTSKTVMVDPGARFVNSVVTCDHLLPTGSSSTYYGDFRFLNSSARARLSWFKSFTAFLSCGAKVLDMDGTDQDIELTSHVTITGATLVGSSETITVPHNDDAKLTLDGCTFFQRGVPVLDMGDNPLYLYSMDVSDRCITGTDVTCTNCNLQARLFRDGATYIAWARSDGDTSFNLGGATVSLSKTVDGEQYYNGVISDMTVTSPVMLQDCTVYHMDTQFDGEVPDDPYTVTMYGCHVLTADHTELHYAYNLHDTRFDCDLVCRQVVADRCTFASISASDYTSNSSITLSNCTCGSLDGINVACYGCLLNGVVWTRDDSSGDITCSFTDCVFTKYQEIKPDADLGYVDPVKVNGTWVGNRFLDADRFISVTNRQGNNAVYLSNTTSDHTWTYTGNTGPAVIPDYASPVRTSVAYRDYGSTLITQLYISFDFRTFGFGLTVPYAMELDVLATSTVAPTTTGNDLRYLTTSYDQYNTTFARSVLLDDYYSCTVKYDSVDKSTITEHDIKSTVPAVIYRIV